MMENRAQLSPERAYEFLSRGNAAVISTVSECGRPEAALINYGVTHDLSLIFETLATSRKSANLMRNPYTALVIGFDDTRGTCQYEGIVDRPEEDVLPELLEDYFSAHPNGLAHRGWPGLIYLRVTPTWIRISNYRERWKIEEWESQENRTLLHATSTDAAEFIGQKCCSKQRAMAVKKSQSRKW